MPYDEGGNYWGIFWGEPETHGLIKTQAPPDAPVEFTWGRIWEPAPLCPHCGKNINEPPLELKPEGGPHWKQRGGLWIHEEPPRYRLSDEWFKQFCEADPVGQR